MKQMCNKMFTGMIINYFLMFFFAKFGEISGACNFFSTA